WPIEGDNAGYIQACAIPNIGRWLSFSPALILKNEINQPSPQLSEPTKPKSPWKIPIPHASEVLDEELRHETLASIEGSHLRNPSMSNKEEIRQLEASEFPLIIGWALKEVQKYGKK
ncbi:11811_t:CDS:2, partial [Entrophospora sp. SA101]